MSSRVIPVADYRSLQGRFDKVVSVDYDRSGVYLVNSVNPFRPEGQKTIVFEMMEQLEWQPPDVIALPGGNLGNTAAFGKALSELWELGLISRMPRLLTVQAAGAAPLVHGAPVAEPEAPGAVEQG